MANIFISYRRQDTRQIAGRIFDRLTSKFGRDGVFMDIDTIPFGVDFHAYLHDSIGRANFVLALIGHGWAEAKDEAGQLRLKDPHDFVRIEIEAALRCNIPLGAVLIDGAPMPQPAQLPESLRQLTRYNAAPVDSGRDFHVHMDRLIADLERFLSGRVGFSNTLQEANVTNTIGPGQIVDPGKIREQIVSTLNMHHLTNAEQDEVLEHLGSVLLERASLALMKQMAEQDLEAMDALVQAGKSEDAMGIIRKSVPNVDAVIASEVQSGLIEYKRFLVEEVEKQQNTKKS